MNISRRSSEDSKTVAVRDKVPLRPHWEWPPLPGRLPKSGSPEVLAEVEERHRRSVAAGQSTYADPMTGLTVFTARFLAERNYCCDSGCRHCPYEPSQQITS